MRYGARHTQLKRGVLHLAWSITTQTSCDTKYILYLHVLTYNLNSLRMVAIDKKIGKTICVKLKGCVIQ